jgi:hypothetical protein
MKHNLPGEMSSINNVFGLLSFSKQHQIQNLKFRSNKG